MRDMEMRGRGFTIEFDGEDRAAAEALFARLTKELPRLLRFFGLEDLSGEKRVVLYRDLKKYREHLAPYVERVEDWMIADTFDGNIHILTLEACRQTREHKHMEEEADYVPVIVHELVHACQQEIEPDSRNCEWFWEALATNLSGQRMREVPLSCTPEQLGPGFMRLADGYPIAYTLGRFLLRTLPKERLLRYCARPDELRADAPALLEAAKREQAEKGIGTEHC